MLEPGREAEACSAGVKFCIGCIGFGYVVIGTIKFETPAIEETESRFLPGCSAYCAGVVVATCSGDGVEVLELASGAAPALVGVGLWRVKLGVDCGALAG